MKSIFSLIAALFIFPIAFMAQQTPEEELGKAVGIYNEISTALDQWYDDKELDDLESLFEAAPRS